MKTNYEHYKELLIDKQYDHCEIYSYDEFMGMECHCCMGCDDHCFVKVIEWLNQPYKEPIQMTLFEKSILECAVNHGYEWIARDSNGILSVFIEKPLKNISIWGAYLWEKYLEMNLFEDKFQFIQWTDEEPTYIPDLLKECEVVG